jgi:hypothetical protein
MRRHRTPSCDTSRSGRRAWRAAGRWGVRLLAVCAAAFMLSPASGADAQVETMDKDVVLNPLDQTIPDFTDLTDVTFDDAYDALLPDTLPLKLPGLDNIGPVSIAQSHITIERPDQIQVGGWKITFEGGADIDVNGTPKTFELTIELEWEDANGDHTPVVEVALASADVFTIGDLQSFGGVLVDGAESHDSLDDQTTIEDVALAFHYDTDGSNPRRWFDITGGVVVGAHDLALHFLYSAESGGAHGDYVISAVRLDSTVAGAEEVRFADLLPGAWGDVAADLGLSEFVLAKVTGSPDGGSLTKNELRIGIPSKFFVGCDDECDAGALPDEFELDADLTLLAKFDLAQLGDAVAAAFDYPGADSVVDLYGKVGIGFAEVEGGQMDLQNVSLRADVPIGDDPNAPADWLDIGGWTFTIDYSGDQITGGITVGAATSVNVDVDGFQHSFDTAATFTRTDDGTISVGATGTSNETFADAFGLDWMDLNSVGLGFSFTVAGVGGDAAFDAMLTSSFTICADAACNQSTTGTLEARLGVTDEARVQFRIAFGQGASNVPIGAVLNTIGQQFDAPDLGATLGGLALDDLSIAITVTTSGEVSFETFAAADLGPPFGAISAYFYAGPGTDGGPPTFFFGARPTSGLTLGQLITPPGGTPPPVIDTIQLPSLGIVAVPLGGFEATSHQLSVDGFRFFNALHGCPDAATADDCHDFKLDLEPGVNLLANITFPGELSDLAEALWLDPATGIQFQGTLALPGIFDPGGTVGAKLGLRLTLPRIEPGNAVEFLEDGSVTLGIELDSGPPPKIALFVEAKLNTRWRRGAEPFVAGDQCPYTSVPLAQFADEDPPPGEDDPTWCYDRLTFMVRSELALTPTGVTMSLLGGLEAPNGWQHPFGVPGFEWLVINDLRLKLELQVPGVPPASVTVNAGFLGEIEIDNPEPGVPNTVLQASFGAGVNIQNIPAPPGVSLTPNFKGIRAYVSRIGMSDVAALQHAMFPDGAPISVDSLPNVEFQNVELMFAIASDPDLCLEPRIGLAGELWIDPVRDDPPGGEVPDEPAGTPCREFGADVDPAECLANQADGCFASVKVTIGLDGIFASGAVASFQLGPIEWQDGLVDIRLKLGEPPIFAISGGVAIEPLGSGELALKFDLLAPRVEFFGELSAFGAFDAQVSGMVGLDVGSLFPPDIEGEFALDAALRADFEAAIRGHIADELDRVAGQLAEIDAALDLFEDDPIGNLSAARDALEAAGIDVPGWVDPVIVYVEDIVDPLIPAGNPTPTYGQLFEGDPYVVTTDAFRSCNLFDTYDPDTDRCYPPFADEDDDYEPDYWCLPGSELHGDECETTIVFPPIGVVVPADLADALEDIYNQALEKIESIDLIPNVTGFGVDDYLTGLADKIEDSRFFTVDCAAFSWADGQGAGDINVRLLLTVLDEQYGFDVGLDLTSPEAGAETIVTELLELFLEGGQQQVECTGPQPKPAWLQTLEDAEESEQVVHLTLAPAGPVAEGEPVTVHGTISPAPTEPIAVTIGWGDETLDTAATVTGDSFTATHTYADDDPSFTAFDVYTVTASSPAAQQDASIGVRVDNVAPGVTLPGLESGQLVAIEGSAVTVEVVLDDVAADTHDAVVRWGDGEVSRLTGVQSPFTVSHTFVDDNPSATPFDVLADGLRVMVIDDDGGSTTATVDVRVDNVVPTVQVTGPDALDEGISARYRFQVSDPGLPDSHRLFVDWGDGTSTRVTLPRTRAIELDHTYRDDDPTATPFDAHKIRAFATDDDTGLGQGELDITVRNVAPVVAITGPDIITVQYSDPIGGDPGTGAISGVEITAYDVADDTLEIAATFAGAEGLPGWLALGTPVCILNGDFHQDCTWTLSAIPDPTTGIHTDIAPGDYELRFEVVDDDTGSHADAVTIRVLPEDARTWYHGPTFAATTSATTGSATLLPRSTVRDITSVVPADAAWDPWPGDIRKATLTFVDRAAASLCAAPSVDAVFSPFDVFIAARSIGVGTCPWVASVPIDAIEYTVGTVIGGYYVRNSGAENAVVTVARPLSSFITGGGFIVVDNSAGAFAGTDGTHANFGFHVKFNKKLTNLQGGANIIVRSGGRVYQIKSNSTDSLGVVTNTAQFEAKASITDVTDPAAPVVIGGNYVLQMRMTDVSELDAADQIGFALWDIRKTGSGQHATTTQLLLFSSNWNGNQTLTQQLGGGNLMVHT